MKKTFLLFMFVCISSLVCGNLYADGNNCTHGQAPCKGLIATLYVDPTPWPSITINIPVPSADDVIGVAGPYASPTWVRSGSSTISVTLSTGMIADSPVEWMEIAVKGGGFYHVKLVYK